MSKKAYLDEDRNQLVNANEFNEKADETKYFYCQNPDCNASLIRKQRNGSYYFSALKSKPHLIDCIYRSSESINVNYNVDGFNFDEFVNNIIDVQNEIEKLNTINKSTTSNDNPKNSEEKERYIRTIVQLYNYCQSHKINDLINNIPIQNILCDSRTRFLYSNFISGNKLLACKFTWAYKEKQILYFKYPIIDDNLLSFSIRAKVENIKLFNVLADRLIKNSDHLILLFSDFRTTNYHDSNGRKKVYTSIYNSKQIHISIKFDD